MQNAKRAGSELLTKNFVLLLTVTMLAGTAITTQMGTLPLLVRSLGGSDAISGLIVGVIGVAALIFRIPTGYLLDRFGRKSILMIGLVILIVDFSGLNIWVSIAGLLLLRFVQGIGEGIEATATGTIAADLIPSWAMTEGLGYFSIAQAAPQAFGPVIGLTIVDHLGFRYLFLTGLILSVAAFGLSLFIEDAYLIKNQRVTISGNIHRGAAKTLFKNRFVIIPSLIIFLICLGNSSVIAFIVQYSRDNHIKGSGYYFLVSTLMTIVIRLFSRLLLSKINQNWLAVMSVILICFDFFMITYTHSEIGLLLAAGSYGAGIGVLLPMMNALVLNHVNDNQKGSATAIFSAGMDVAYGGGVMLLGLIATAFSFQIMFLTCVGLSITALVILIGFNFWFNKKI